MQQHLKGQYPQHSTVDRDERFARWFTSLKPYFSLIDPSHVSTSKCSIIRLVQATKRNFKRILHLKYLTLTACSVTLRKWVVYTFALGCWADGPSSVPCICTRGMIYITVSTDHNVTDMLFYSLPFFPLFKMSTILLKHLFRHASKTFGSINRP